MWSQIVLAKIGHINQILEIQMYPVSQTQRELVFKNTTPRQGGLPNENFWEFIPWTFWELPNLLQCGRLLRMTFKSFFSSKTASTGGGRCGDRGGGGRGGRVGGGVGAGGEGKPENELRGERV